MDGLKKDSETPEKLSHCTLENAPIASFWIDAKAQAADSLPRKVVLFGSPAYFALADEDKRVRSWLALGSEITFIWKGTVYELKQPGE